MDTMDLELAPDGTDFVAVLADGIASSRSINPLLGPLGSRTWRWDVTPRHHGRHNLSLYAYIYVKRADGQVDVMSALHDDPVAKVAIDVKLERWHLVHSALSWMQEFWTQLAATGGLIVWFLRWLQKRLKSKSTVPAASAQPSDVRP
jgi:hypothetical protein